MGSIFVWQLKHILDYLCIHLSSVGWQWWVLSMAVSTLLVIAYLHRRRGRTIHKHQVIAFALLGLYVTILLSMTVFARGQKTDVMSANLDVFGTLAKRFSSFGEPKTEVVVNSLMLMPFGLLLPLATGCDLRTTVISALVITIAIETVQLVSLRGWFELSDLFLNVFSAVVGYGAFFLSMRFATHGKYCFTSTGCIPCTELKER